MCVGNTRKEDTLKFYLLPPLLLHLKPQQKHIELCEGFTSVHFVIDCVDCVCSCHCSYSEALTDVDHMQLLSEAALTFLTLVRLT